MFPLKVAKCSVTEGSKNKQLCKRTSLKGRAWFVFMNAAGSSYWYDMCLQTEEKQMNCLCVAVFPPLNRLERSDSSKTVWKKTLLSQEAEISVWRCGHFRRFCECSLVCGVSSQGGGSDAERTKKKKRGDRYSVQTSLIVAALKKMLPIGLNMCSPADQELVNLAKIRYSLVASHAAAAAAVKLLSLTVARNETKHLCCRETLMKRCESSCRTTFICKARYHISCALEMITKIQWS